MPPPLMLSSEPPKNLPPLDKEAESEKREISRLLRFTSWRHPIHKSVDAKTGELMESPDAARLCKILRDSLDYQWRERTAAALILRQIEMSPTQARYAARVLGDAMNGGETIDPNAKYKRSAQEYQRRITLIAAIAAGVFLLGAAIRNGIMPEWVHQILCDMGNLLAALSLFWFPALLTLDQRRQLRLRTECAVTLRHLKLPESVRAFAVLAQSRKSYASIAQDALREILPLLTPEHYGRLEVGTVPALCQLLRDAPLLYNLLYPAPLCESVLDALAKIGDGSAVKPVQMFAKKCPVPILQAKATEILPILLERKTREEAHSILLRSASTPAAPEKELLRAASSTPETAPELLLRASQIE